MKRNIINSWQEVRMLILLASIAKRLIGNYELRMDELINKQDIRWQLQETAYIFPKQQGASFHEVSMDRQMDAKSVTTD